MSRQLWLLRHGEAEDHGVRPDAERRLTQRGEAQSTAAGKALSVLGLDFAAVFTSPKVRARDTAALACEQLGATPIEQIVLAGSFDRSDALELLGVAEADQRVLLVGHEPDLSQLVYDLCGARVDFKKGGVAAMRMEGTAAAELIVLLRPRELAAIAAGHDA